MKISRSASREMAFVLLFEFIMKGDESAQEIWDNAVEFPNLKQSPYASSVFFGCTENMDKVNAVIEPCLVGWKQERVSYVSRAVLLLATYEMMFGEDVPYKVAIDEALNLSKKYESGNAFSFINGVLNAVAESLSLK